MSSINIEILAMMVDNSDFVWVDVSISFGIWGKSIVRPGAFPKSYSDVSVVRLTSIHGSLTYTRL